MDAEERSIHWLAWRMPAGLHWALRLLRCVCDVAAIKTDIRETCVCTKYADQWCVWLMHDEVQSHTEMYNIFSLLNIAILRVYKKWIEIFSAWFRSNTSDLIYRLCIVYNIWNYYWNILELLLNIFLDKNLTFVILIWISSLIIELILRVTWTNLLVFNI